MIKKKTLTVSLMIFALSVTVVNAESTAEVLNRTYSSSLATITKSKLEQQLVQLKDALREQKVITAVNASNNQSSNFIASALKSEEVKLTKVVDNFNVVRNNYLSALKSRDINRMLETEKSYLNSIDNVGSITRITNVSVSTFNPTEQIPDTTEDEQSLRDQIDSVTKNLVIANSSGDYDYGVIPTAFPVIGEVTSVFGTRTDPLYGDLRFHSGVDIGASTGTPVPAWFNGIVTKAENGDSLKGNYVTVALGDVETSYLHLSTVLVQAGQEVKQGDIVGTVGSTGKSTGPHLHLSLTIQGISVDPSLLVTGGE